MEQQVIHLLSITIVCKRKCTNKNPTAFTPHNRHNRLNKLTGE